jgi:NAD(P)-dependent dehydrogenase (short-subunit alcohol dehydrogenase family)
MFDFTKRVVVITGAAGNLGQTLVEVFESAGAALTLVDRSPNRLERIFPALAGSAEHFLAQSVDITDANSIDKMVKEVLKRFGRIDVLVNAAGGYAAGTPVHETPLETWDSMFNLNARSVFIVSRACIPQMLNQRSGKIINLASRAAVAGEAKAAIYSASKTVVVRLTESMAAELKNSGINVNCVLPGTIDTPTNREAMPQADWTKWVAPKAVADVILFLASDRASAVHGAAMPVFGPS